MKHGLTIIAVLLMGLSSNGFAQDTKEMMERLEKAQACMHDLDRTELKRVQAQFQALQADIKQLCDSGQSDQAKTKAVAFAEELDDSLVIDQVKKCAKIMGDMMPEMPLLDVPDDYGEINICGQ